VFERGPTHPSLPRPKAPPCQPAALGGLEDLSRVEQAVDERVPVAWLEPFGDPQQLTEPRW
jgi:hypothetical protein